MTAEGDLRRAAAHPVDWTATDAWVLGAVLLADRPFLVDVIAAADFLQHELPSYDELVAAARRLRGAQLLEPYQPWLPTPRARRLRHRVVWGTHRSRVPRLLRGLRRVRAVTVTADEWVLPSEEYVAAVSAYLRRA